jgi:hypothetical protein
VPAAAAAAAGAAGASAHCEWLLLSGAGGGPAQASPVPGSLMPAPTMTRHLLPLERLGLSRMKGSLGTWLAGGDEQQRQWQQQWQQRGPCLEHVAMLWYWVGLRGRQVCIVGRWRLQGSALWYR